MPFSEYLSNRLLDLVLKGQSFTLPSNLFLSIHSGNPSPNGGNAISVARQPVSFNDASGNSSFSNVEVTFSPVPSETMFSHIGLWDSLSGGNFLYWGQLGTSRVVFTGEVVRFQVSSVIVQHITS